MDFSASSPSTFSKNCPRLEFCTTTTKLGEAVIECKSKNPQYCFKPGGKIDLINFYLDYKTQINVTYYGEGVTTSYKQVKLDGQTSFHVNYTKPNVTSVDKLTHAAIRNKLQTLNIPLKQREPITEEIVLQLENMYPSISIGKNVLDVHVVLVAKYTHVFYSNSPINFNLPRLGDCEELYRDKCSTCLEGFTVDRRALMLPCFHPFHKHCIKTWLMKKPSCPVCRVPTRWVVRN